MKDKVKKLKLRLNKAKNSWYFVSISIKKILRRNQRVSDYARHYLFQCQVSLYSDKLLLKKYQEKISLLKEDTITEEEFEYIFDTLTNLITDHQAKAIAISNISKSN